MGNFLSGGQGAQKSQGGLSTLLQFIPGVMNSFKGINTGAQSNIAGQQQNVANAIYDPSNPLYQQLYGQQRQNIQQQGAATISQAANQNRQLSSMGRTPLFSPERNGEQLFRQGVMNQQGADLEAQNQTRGILSGAMGGLNNAFSGANDLSRLQYGNTKIGSGANNQNQAGFDSIAALLRRGGY